MKKVFISLAALALLVVPAIALAQTPRPDFNYANDWATQLIQWAKDGVTVLMIVATLYFIWTVISYIRVKEAKDADEKKKAMIRGIIGLFVIVAIWGIVRVLTTTLGVNGSTGAQIVCPPGLTPSGNRCI